MNFKVSEKVVCVDTSKPNRANKTGRINRLKLGRIYVIRDILVGPSYKNAGVRLVGMCAGFWMDGEEAGYSAYRFRKLDEIREENRAKAVRELEIHGTTGTRMVPNSAA